MKVKPSSRAPHPEPILAWPRWTAPAKPQLNSVVVSPGVLGSGQGTEQVPSKCPLVDWPQEFI